MENKHICLIEALIYLPPPFTKAAPALENAAAEVVVLLLFSFCNDAEPEVLCSARDADPEANEIASALLNSCMANCKSVESDVWLEQHHIKTEIIPSKTIACASMEGAWSHCLFTSSADTSSLTVWTSSAKV